MPPQRNIDRYGIAPQYDHLDLWGTPRGNRIGGQAYVNEYWQTILWKGKRPSSENSESENTNLALRQKKRNYVAVSYLSLISARPICISIGNARSLAGKRYRFSSSVLLWY